MLISPESLAVLGGAIALAGGLAGSAIGIGLAASAGAAILADDPRQFRNVLILAALPMTQTFYGLIVLIIVLTTVIPRVAEMGAGYGFAVLGIGVIAAAAELISAVYQGAVCASGISLLSKTKGGIFTHTLILAVYVELLGVLGLVFSIMALSLIGVM
ncbi:MAG: V-type sodium ATPase subunit K [Dehalococcoidia bacterium]|nr:V-type sodium ATPase subunit K [Bacillota bacterium]MBT9144061.1 V-type sodium ATPase subunit K [Bacillota bacterium]